MSNRRPRICVVGTGNASHVFIALFSSQGYIVDVYASYKDEALRLSAALATTSGITVHDRCHPDKKTSYTGRPHLVSKDPKSVIPTADVVVMALPSFAFRPVFREIRDHLKKDAIVFGMPGQGGFDLVAQTELGDRFGEVTIAGLIPMPLNCRIIEFGKAVDLAALKDKYDLAAVPARNAGVAARMFTQLLGKPVRALGHYAAMALHASNPNIHPARLYGLFSDFKDGKIYAENPLFYETFDATSATWAQRVSDERLKVWRTIVAKMKEMKVEIGDPNEVPDLKQYIINIYGDQIHDKSSLASVFSTNDGFKGFRCPMKRLGNGWTLDFQNRYFVEDIPEGFCVYKGLADLAGVPTPTIDKILGFFQNFMHKEYLRDGSLSGKDVKETKAPQAFGIKTLEQYILRMAPEKASNAPAKRALRSHV